MIGGCAGATVRMRPAMPPGAGSGPAESGRSWIRLTANSASAAVRIPLAANVGVQPMPESAAESGAVESSCPNAPQAAVSAAASA